MRQHFLKSPRGIGLVLGSILATLCGLTLFVTLMLCNLLQMLSLVVYPFSRKLFRFLNGSIAGLWWSSCVVGGDKLYGIRRTRNGDPLPYQENAVVFANHESMPDIVVLLSVGLEVGSTGRMKWFAKDTLKYVPGLGWGLSFLDTLFLKRHWEQDKGAIEKTFGKFIREDIPVWLTLFPEGTRITPSKSAASRAYAEKAKLKPLDCVLIPRTKGFIASVRALTPVIDAIYDVTIVYPQGIPSLWQWMAGWARAYHVHVRRFPVDSLPADDEALAKWLLKKYEEKDELLNYFHDHGKFPGS